MAEEQMAAQELGFHARLRRMQEETISDIDSKISLLESQLDSILIEVVKVESKDTPLPNPPPYALTTLGRSIENVDMSLAAVLAKLTRLSERIQL